MLRPPEPEQSKSVGEFVAALRALRLWSGLSYRELTAKARASGASLPPSTITSMLGRSTLPRASLVETFVLACGLDEDTAARWVDVRNRLALESEHPASKSSELLAHRSESTEQEPADPEVEGPSWLRPVVVGLTALGLVITVAVFLLYGQTDSRHDDTVGKSKLPTEGWYLIQPAHIPDKDLCIGEGRERNRRTDRPLAVQRPCTSIVPDTYLAATGIGGVYEIRWHHPKEGVGCLTVDEALTDDETLVAPTKCTGASHQRYQFEPTQTPVPNGYRIRPTHSGLCLGILGGVADVGSGAEVAQSQCTGAADQVFLLQPVTRSS